MNNLLSMSWVDLSLRGAAERAVNEAFGLRAVAYTQFLARPDAPSQPVAAWVCNATSAPFLPALMGMARAVCGEGVESEDGREFVSAKGGVRVRERAGARADAEAQRDYLGELGLTPLVIDEDATGELRAQYAELGLMAEEE